MLICQEKTRSRKRLVASFKLAIQSKRYCLNISLLGPAKLTDKEDFGGVALQEEIDIAYKETSKYLLEIMFNKYKFVEHLKV